MPTSLRPGNRAAPSAARNRTVVRRGQSESIYQGSRKHSRKRRPSEIGTAAGCAIFLVTSAGAALAQDQAGDEEIGEVVVTGLRKSITGLDRVKKDESSIVEVVSAEDIGKLPDASIAESIGRLPGIAAQRTNGRAQTLSIRGLGPDFTVTTFNGREQASTNDNRTVEFDQYPSELVNQVKIYKTPDAGMATRASRAPRTSDRAPAGLRRSQVRRRLQARDERPGREHSRLRMPATA
jgi:hypothetical protein